MLCQQVDGYSERIAYKGGPSRTSCVVEGENEAVTFVPLDGGVAVEFGDYPPTDSTVGYDDATITTSGENFEVDEFSDSVAVGVGQTRIEFEK
jgi:hypothetical protein